MTSRCRRARRATSAAGYTIVELLVATAVVLTMTAGIAGLIRQAQASFQAQPEISDMHQRLRVAIDALARDLMMAGAGTAPATSAPVMPYRVGDEASDPELGVFYRPDTLTIQYVPWGETAIASHTYYLRTDTWQLMHYDGATTDFPLVDHVVKLEFAYFDAGESPLEPDVLQDGPWVPDDPEAMTFDVDLLRIRRVRVLLRIEAALASMRGPSGTLFARAGTSTAMERYVPDHELRFDVAVRNANRGR